MDSRLEISRRLTAGGGVLALAAHPDLRRSLRWLVSTGELATVLPGVCAVTGTETDPAIRMRAALARHPDAVLCGAAAARLTFWPKVGLSRIEVAHRTSVEPRTGYTFTQRRIPPELVIHRHGLRCTDPALTAIDLATIERADAIDVALRTRAATLAGMQEALRMTAHRAGNRDRRLVLLDSRDEPWSGAERLAHRRLREARITGWRSNLPVLVRGRRYYLDIAFRRQKLAIEIDGRIHQLDAELFESDRRRQNDLVLDGWRVLRFTWLQLEADPDGFSAAVRQALAQLR